MKRLFQVLFAFTLAITCLCLPEKAKASYTTIYAVLENNDKIPFLI